ncbi:hypothetical protein HC000_07680 [Pseudoalteromonas sp. MIP2626]|uniref:hypothetical protein n=1 Tax=Pseudoalteromonas sp. MIP2626 TaxID=2705464 RepID=UPI0015CEE78E|nr:hypothetical protein [Pseudoalteromonas sp. MIP2626]NYR12374.1 hypothetical protein [Pseudoalteromonas sp. MIP2626]
MDEQLIGDQTLKQSVLLLLEDSEVREKVREIMFKPAVNTTLETTVVEDSVISDDTLIQKLQEEDNNLEVEVIKLRSENEEMKEIIIKLKSLLGLKDSALNKSNEAVLSLNQDKSGLEANLSTVTSNLNQNKQSLSEVSSNYKYLKTEYDSIKAKYEEQEKKIAYYRDNFEEDLRIKEIYDDLSNQTKLSTDNIFTDPSVKGLVACGIQEKYIFNLWDYIKAEVVKGNNPDQERLIRLFELLFKRFKLAYPMFELQLVKTGDKFDTQSHIKHNKSDNMSGDIQSVLFHGCINTKTGKVLKPSIVIL